MPNWKSVFSSILNGEVNKELLEKFAQANQWYPDVPQKKFEKIAADLSTYKGPNLLEILGHLYPSIEPGILLLDHFSYFVSVLLNPEELNSVESVTNLVSTALRSSLPPESSFQERLITCERKLLDCYVIETHHRWKMFEGVASGSKKFDRIAMDPARIPKLETVIFAFGIDKPLIFYQLLNDMAMDPSTRLHSLMLLKSFLILQVNNDC
jgi:hypothetical protein